MAVVSAATIIELRKRIADHFLGYLVDVYGPATVPQADLDRLVLLGIIDEAAAREIGRDYLHDAFIAGMLAARLGDVGLTITGYTAAEIEAELLRNPIILSEKDKEALEWARQGAALNCRHLGERATSVGESVVWTFNEDQRAHDEAQIRESTAQAKAERRSPGWLRGELGRRLDMYEQDLDRIACTELQDAECEGAARGILNKHGADASVVKIPNPKACAKCRELYIGDDGNPKVFRLADLVANGTNVGRKREDWLPVVGTTHPWCACFLRRLPPGFEFKDGIIVPIGGKP